jgi:hypothetical protein
MERVIHKLKKPVEIKNADGHVIETITELSLRELVGGDADRITGTAPFPITVQMVGAASELPPSYFAKVPLFEILAACEVAERAGFFGDIQAILKK